MRPNRLALLIAGLLAFLFILVPLLSVGVGLAVDWTWFSQVGFREIFVTIVGTQVELGIACGGIFLLLTGSNLWAARGVAHRSGYLATARPSGRVADFPNIQKFPAVFRRLTWLGVVVLAFIVGQWSATHWDHYLLATHAAPMAETDPIFGIHLSFYMFRLPFLFFVYHLALITLLASMLAAAVWYLIEGGVWMSPRGLGMGRNARRHLLVLGGLLFLLLAWRARLGMYDLVYSAGGLVYGAGYTDIHVGWPVLWIQLVLCLIAAIAFFSGARDGRVRPAQYATGGVLAMALLGGLIAPTLVQWYLVAPSELEKEQPYIARNIKFTRQAYGLDQFDERDFPAIQDLTAGSIQENATTMRNLRLWDHEPQLTTFQQLQEIRTYYDFVQVYNDRYNIHGELRQVSLSARELSADSLPDPNWVNQHLIYTHGYGLCLGPVNESTPDGLPVFFIKDIPPASSISLKVTRPEIYYGQLSNNYCLVGTGAKEFDYPSGEDNVYNVYRGSGGVPVGGLWRRLLFALHFGNANILLSSYIQPASRIMIYRRVLDRVQALAPFLSFDGNPYLVITDDGSLQWIVDAYTTSDEYPYSDPTTGVGNYIRNSVKITINAYSGEVRFYVSDPSDPVIQTYESIFPGVFHPLSEMPPDLRAHVRYPQDFFAIQAAKYAVYHMTDPSVFYSKEDLWRVATRSVNGESAPMSPYYAVMKLPEVGTTEEFILMVPFTPARKNNMIAWMAARCDGPDYGKVLVFNFPKEKLIYGPEQIQSRLNQTPAISQQLTLWDQGGSRVIHGTLLVVPVQNAVMYVEPLYLASEGGSSLPQLKRVIVAYSDQVVMEPSLDEALNAIFGGNAGGNAGGTPETAASGTTPAIGAAAVKTLPASLENLIQQANQHYEKAQQDLRQGDWSGYGQEIDKLGEILKQMPAKDH
ncbi:MAG TPA: UPF0182 family protein [Candidatus Acidoferrales bacterium]|nr:UPF0182 family protein [Candidatus Acidoferrales bacterium]